mgnify:CR=1 FL=1
MKLPAALLEHYPGCEELREIEADIVRYCAKVCLEERDKWLAGNDDNPVLDYRTCSAAILATFGMDDK